MDQLLREIDPIELDEWRIFFGQAKFGPAAEEYRTGLLAATIENWSQKKSGDWADPGDFFKSAKKPKLTREQLRAKMEAWAIGMGWDGKTQAEMKAEHVDPEKTPPADDRGLQTSGDGGGAG